MLSEANRKRLSSLLESLRAVETDIDELLTSTAAPEKGADVGGCSWSFSGSKPS